MATKMSMVSMLAMEATENMVDYYLTGMSRSQRWSDRPHPHLIRAGGVMNFASVGFWASMAVSMAAGYLVPLPYNYFMLRRFGKSCH